MTVPEPKNKIASGKQLFLSPLKNICCNSIVTRRCSIKLNDGNRHQNNFSWLTINGKWYLWIFYYKRNLLAKPYGFFLKGIKNILQLIKRLNCFLWPIQRDFFKANVFWNCQRLMVQLTVLQTKPKRIIFIES